jgi:hypothetical protein
VAYKTLNFQKTAFSNKYIKEINSQILYLAVTVHFIIFNRGIIDYIHNINVFLQIGWLHEKDVTLFTMHDLVHDLARSVMVDEILDASKQKNKEGGSCRYALLTDCSKSLKLTAISPIKIRTIRFLDSGKSELCNGAFLSAKYLRVLDLGECSIKKFPDSVEQLKQLRYLNAPRIQNRMFPKCITKLLKLNYLNLRGSSSISAIPVNR